jgi:hypothetical protein
MGKKGAEEKIKPPLLISYFFSCLEDSIALLTWLPVPTFYICYEVSLMGLFLCVVSALGSNGLAPTTPRNPMERGHSDN